MRRWIESVSVWLLTASVAAAAAPGVPLSGRVVDARGRPVEATVRLLAGEAVLVATADAEGKFAFTDLRDSVHTVRVEARGFAALTAEARPGGAPLELRLEAGREVAGHVIDANGRPVARAEVRGCDESGIPFGAAACATAVTDSGGRFTFEHLANEPAIVGAAGPGFAWRQVDVAADVSGPVVLRLPEGLRVEGVLRDDTGAPLPDTRIRIELLRSKGPGDAVVDEPQVVTDATGRFAHPGIEPGFYLIRADRAGWYGERARFVAGRGGTREVELVARPYASVEFALEDAAGTAVTEDVRVEIDEMEPRTVRPDRRGRYVFAEVPPVGVSLRLLPERCVPIDVDPFEYEAGTSYDLGTLRARPGALVEGVVTDGGGGTVPDADVFVETRDAEPVLALRTRSDAEGRFAFDNLPSDVPLTFAARADGYVGEPVELDAGAAVDVTLPMSQRSGVRGVVVDPDGEPRERFTAQLHGEAVAAGERARVSGTRVEAPGGRFVLDDVPAATYTLEITAEGFAPTAVDGVVVEADRLTDLGTIELDPGRRLDGLVVDAGGDAVAGAAVEVRELERAITSDADGRFSLDGMKPGRWTFVVRHPRYAELVEARALPQGSFGERAVWTLSEGGSVRGRVRRGETPLDAQLSLGSSTSRERPRDAETDARGEFFFERVAPGTYELTAFGGDGTGTVPPRLVSVVEGRETFVDLDADAEIRLTGRVTLADRPLSTAGLEFSRENSLLSTLARANADEDGFFEARLPGPGRYRVQVFLGRIKRNFRFVLGDEEEVRRDFALEGGSISGVVYGPDGAPVAASIAARVEGGTLLEGYHETYGASDGTFRFLGLPAGRYRVAAELEGIGAAEVGPLDVGDGAVDGVEIFLEDTAPTVRGRIVDAFGLAVRDALVVAVPSGRPDSALASTATCDVHGRFALRAPDDGPLDLIAFGRNRAPATRTGFTPGFGGEDEVTLTLGPGATLAVRLTDADGRPLPGLAPDVDAVPSTLAWEIQRAFSPPAPSGPDGVSLLSGLPPGRYRVTAPGGATVDVVVRDAEAPLVELRVP